MANIAKQIGFSDDEHGPYVTELRRALEAKQASGMTKIHVSWASWPPTEAHARELLAIDWALAHGEAYSVKSMDGGLLRCKTDVRTMKRTWRVNWPWFADLGARLAYRARIAWNRARGVRNPYRSPPHA